MGLTHISYYFWDCLGMHCISDCKAKYNTSCHCGSFDKRSAQRKFLELACVPPCDRSSHAMQVIKEPLRPLTVSQLLAMPAIMFANNTQSKLLISQVSLMTSYCSCSSFSFIAHLLKKVCGVPSSSVISWGWCLCPFRVLWAMVENNSSWWA